MSRSKHGRLLSRQRGLTLVELMVALVMGLVLLGGVVTVFVANKETYRVQDALARVQENGRFALSLLTRELRTSGLLGCSTLKPRTDPRNTIRGTGLFQSGSRFEEYAVPGGSPQPRPVEGFEATSATAWSPPLDVQILTRASNCSTSDVAANCLPSGGTDVLLARVVDGYDERVASHASTGAPLILQSSSRLQAEDIAIVSDCEGAAVFRVTGVSGATVTHNVDLGKLFPSAATSAEVQEIRNTAYFVAPSSSNARNLNCSGQMSTAPLGCEFSLWRWDGRGPAQEMAQGIEAMQIRYGVDTNGDQAVDQYDTAQAVENGNNWGNVISVRVSIGVRSPDQNVVSEGRAYLLDGSTVTVATTDTRLRQVFTTTIAVRNRQS